MRSAEFIQIFFAGELADEEILDMFEIDIYTASQSLPSDSYWIGGKIDTAAV